jgi:hypothetical protein
LANLRREAVLDLCLHGMRLAGTTDMSYLGISLKGC